MRPRLAAIAVAVLTIAQLAACSSDEPTSCADLAARIATLEAPSDSSDPSWDSIQAVQNRLVERDGLRAQEAQRGCT
jgi:uncharacterized lipoprotein